MREDHCEVLVMSRRNFDGLMNMEPAIAKIVRSNAAQYKRDNYGKHLC
jgi:hypothetical protein